MDKTVMPSSAHDTDDRRDDDRKDDRETVEIFVNEKPVVVRGRKQTGASIKAAAIAQGVEIQPNFVLSLELGGGRTKLVGDDEKINVKPGMRFLAIANDDNS